MGTIKNKQTPRNVEAVGDPGDETLRNYRYQVAYGVILLVGAACKKLPYKNIYAEHHEDYLCERDDDKFDGYQVKTRKPEEGSWEILDEPLQKSIKRFVELYQKFEEYIGKLKFVSNAEFSEPSSKSHDETKIRKSPIRFLNHIIECESISKIQAPFLKTFQELQNYCQCSPDVLFNVLKRIDLVKGPDRNSFDSDLVAIHLPSVDGCSSMAISNLNALRDELIQKVFYASSLKIDDPSKHWSPVNSNNEQNPIILAKRVSVLEVPRTVNNFTSVLFRYSNTHHPAFNLGDGKGNLYRLRKKMLKGDLALQVETMERRSLSAESRLIEIAHRKPESFDDLFNQLIGVVKGECDEAYHHASLNGGNFGPKMLDDVYKRLKEKATNSLMVHNEPYETLIGIAGLLTGECKVWWSEKFDIEDDRHGS